MKNVKLAYAEAQNELNLYLNPEKKDTQIVDKVETDASNVNTGINQDAELFLGSLVVGGAAFAILLRKQREEENL